MGNVTHGELIWVYALGKAAEMKVEGIVRGGNVYQNSFYFTGSRSVGNVKVVLNETLKYHKKD